MFTFRWQIIWFILALITSCNPNHGEHMAGIGRKYTFTSFTLFTRTGASFSLSPAELRDLEKIWPTAAPGSVAISNAVIGTSPKLTHSFTLNDGYSESLDAFLGTASGVDYLGVTVPGDGGGFTADAYIQFVPLSSIFSATRRSDLHMLLGGPAPTLGPALPPAPTGKEEEQAPRQHY